MIDPKIRFWKKVDKKGKDECWNWKGAIINKSGYGRFDSNKFGVIVYAHRYSYELVNGKLSKGMCALHKCDNPGCVNPNHLFVGTMKDNTQDCIKKGRHISTFGENNPISKLNNKEVLKIVCLYKSNRYTVKELGRMFGVTRFNIYAILNGKIWNRITGIPATGVMLKRD